MGNCVFQDTKEKEEASPKLPNLQTKNTFEKLYVVGKGGFGKVWKVQSKRQKTQLLALKEMSKARVLQKNSLNTVLMERQILSQLDHSFIVNMKAAFQDRDNLYLALDYCSGGDLRYHIPHKCFDEQETKFMIACVILALEYVHSKGIIHRDIKPENLVFDDSGYLNLTDFGIARQLPNFSGALNSQTTIDFLDIATPQEGVIETSGTPGYMSPEAMCKLPHSFVSDYFALGVIVYEMMLRKRPYNGQSKVQIRDSMLAKQVQIKPTDIPVGWSDEAADFANKLLMRKPSSRLGFYSGIQELKMHPWFKRFDWQLLANRKMKAPWNPPKGDNFKGKNLIFDDDESLQAEADIFLQRNTVQKWFDEYYYEPKFPMKIRTLKRITYIDIKEQQLKSMKKMSRNQNNLDKLKKIRPLNMNQIERHDSLVEPVVVEVVDDKQFEKTLKIRNSSKIKSRQSIQMMGSATSFASTGITSRKGSSFIASNQLQQTLKILKRHNA